VTVTWLDDSLITDVKLTHTPPSRSATGYGAKIPTAYMLKLGKRWHRVYMMQYSNSGTPYVVKGGEDLVLETATEHRLQKQMEGVGTPTPIDQLEVGDRFRFRPDEIIRTFQGIEGAKYRWADYSGLSFSQAPSYRSTGRTAWPYVYPTTDPETAVGS
jgi:hypothetical protein